MKNKVKIVFFCLLLLTITVVMLLTFKDSFKLLETVAVGYQVAIEIAPRASYSVSNVPIQIILNQNNFDFRTYYEDGSDIKFTDSSGNILKHYIARYSKTYKYGDIWILIPNLPAAPNKIKVYMYYGSETKVPQYKDVFPLLIDYEGATLAWQSKHAYVEVISTSSEAYERTYCQRIRWTSTALESAYAILPWSPSDSQNIVLWVKRSVTYTGKDSGFDIIPWSNKEIGYVRIYNDGSVGIYTLTASISYPGVIPNEVWRQITISLKYSTMTFGIVVRSPDGTILHEYSATTYSSTSVPYTNTLAVRTWNGYYQTIFGDLYIDFTSFQPYNYPLPNINMLPPPEYRIEFVNYKDLSLPPQSPIEMVLRLFYGENILAGTQFTFTILNKNTYPGFSVSSSTNSTGYATVKFTSPPSTFSPYTLKIVVEGKELTYSLYVLNGINVIWIDRKTTYYYDVSGNWDILVQGKLTDIESNNDLTGYGISLMVTGPDGKTITSTYSISGSIFTLKAKVYDTYKDLAPREVTFKAVFSLTGYAMKTEQFTVRIEPSSIIAKLDFVSTVIPVGTKGLKIYFIDSATNTPASLKPEEVEVAITDPNGVTLYLSQMNPNDYYWNRGIETSLSIYYEFSKAGKYKIDIVYNIANRFVPPYSVELTVVESSNIPLNWIVVGIIGLILFYFLFLRGEKSEKA